MINQFVKRVLLLGLACLLLTGALPAATLPTAQAVNTYGPTLAAWRASDLMGVPYRVGGADPLTGLDNSGLVYYVYRQLGVDMPRTLSEQWKYGVALSKSELAPGDLVFFRDTSIDQAISVGIYLKDGGFVSVTGSSAKVVRHLLSEGFYTRYFLGAKRIPEAAFAALSDVVASKALELQGLPYAEGQASRQGADTAGLVKYIYGFIYLDVPNSLIELAKTGVSVSRSSLRPGDMVFFSSLITGAPYRVGLYVGNQQFLVTSDGLGQAVLRSLTDSFYAQRYMDARRPYARFVPPANFSKPIVPTTSTADLIVQAALGRLGKPYKLGAAGPDYYDCSGLTRTVYAQFGYKLPRASYSQATVGTPVGLDSLEKGDLVFFSNTWRNDGSIDHVAIYMGDGMVVHAIGEGVTTSSLTGYWVNHFALARRVIER